MHGQETGVNTVDVTVALSVVTTATTPLTLSNLSHPCLVSWVFGEQASKGGAGCVRKVSF